MYGHQYFDLIGFQHYSASPQELLCRMTEIDTSHVIHSEWFCRPAKPAHVICIDHKHKTVVLSLRGRSNFQDFMWDLKCVNMPFEESVVHGGLLNSAKWLQKHLDRPLKDAFLQNDDYKLVVCGHSMGGAVAALLTILFSKDELYKNRKVHAYCFGSPCVVGHELSFTSQDFITSIVLGTDVIARFSAGSIANLADVTSVVNSKTSAKSRTSVNTFVDQVDEIQLLAMLNPTNLQR
eukprot:TRINITY_DN11234_c0_g1_i1.p1 TRINITY_DN11234_c0_g1~~TRINITY_DN11234_c0_g1_i1.p1  ORF type:complete len:236 (-),score=33.52 TRINITY_DN11234_c0_g1_i1:50-757(-)